MTIVCLHTAKSNIAVYEAAAKALGLPEGTLRHHVRADLLLAAEKLGRLTDEISAETAALLWHLAEDADAVVLNCSTLGPAVSKVAAGAGAPIIRADAALAEQAVKAGGKVLVLCTVETTIIPTTALFEAAAKATGAEIEVRLVPGAWTHFRSGDLRASIADAVREAHGEGAVTLTFAQASMTGAVDLLSDGIERPITGPATALAAAIAKIATADLL
ncbi:aspartate/glutamate racemase family protein [Rhizobium sp. CNPSo 3968]|uniref:aspartate/glutamate racemase family protein n=1 Tax=unclassified Rhizobium TaxID=2613769 RepID=UPI000DE02074|nr:aspartate/glutamate racemase family protein [Rhizobium sp. CNPSo 3968]MBB3288029.1 Asp/Glu/hydantoin racemase [Rhizobium sp. BK252]MBB3403108.1 Asp/Glu/hydantoin racemase [Rhizobium sp. BK289]MBB3415685.1 Asp/Glu/hydantoin racemase [Rhizobium sp. BK284]MBB3483235.1 Asp/Glu/hydantoin racemase [Rhizobium sp. BK347]MDK4723901.1 Asp/Glu racemase [Rhizobium sp. CNPSo 3968]